MSVKTTNHRVEARWTTESGKDRAKVIGTFDTKEAAIDLMNRHVAECSATRSGPTTTFRIVPTTSEFYVIIGGEVIDSPLTHDEVIRAARTDDNIGLCIFCGDEHSNCEPDMRREKCDSCGQFGVYGAEELVMRIG